MHLVRLGNKEEEPIHATFSVGELEVLRYIGKTSECIISDVTKLLEVAPTTVTSLMKRLERKNLISRKRTDSNRRVVFISLTKEGKEIVRLADKEQDARTEKILLHLTTKEQDIMLRLSQSEGV